MVVGPSIANLYRSALESAPGPSPAAMRAVDRALNLSGSSRGPLVDRFSLRGADLEDFLSLLSDLLANGIVGTETLEVNGEPYTSFITTRIGAPHLRDARLYPDRSFPAHLFDARV